jgi:hypothetical protein
VRLVSLDISPLDLGLNSSCDSPPPADALVAQKLVVYPGGLFVVQSPLEERPKDTPFIRLSPLQQQFPFPSVDEPLPVFSSGCTFAGTVEQSDKALRVLGKVVREFFDPKEIGGDGDI